MIKKNFVVIILSICLLQLGTSIHSKNKNTQTQIPPINVADTSDIFLGEKYHTGFIDIDPTSDIFYWYFESRLSPTSDPLVFWLTGGPGCSSMLAALTENGPFFLNPEDLTLKKNEYSWNYKSNVVYIDQPVGTGFSKAGISDYVVNEKGVAKDFYIFLIGFLNKYPEFIKRPIYITGESYAGHYIPAITAYLLQQNNPNINLQGIAIGNGLVDPYYQNPQYARYAFEENLIGNYQYQALKLAYTACQAAYKTKIWIATMLMCQIPTDVILGNPLWPRFNVYDIRLQCAKPPLCYDLSYVKRFLERADVVAALGVQGRQWSSCNYFVNKMMTTDYVHRLNKDMKYILDHQNHVKVLIYNGDQDFICNWRGSEKWTEEQKWKNQQSYKNMPFAYWNQGQTHLGEYRSLDNFTFLRVYDAGHMVPMDQPKAALLMLNRFIYSNWNEL